MKVLVTGGAGYIGSHTCVELLAAGHEVVVIDDLSNSHEEVLRRIETITGKKVPFYRGRVQDLDRVTAIVKEHAVDAAIHFAAFKAVGESVAKPIDYYENNLTSLTSLVRALDAAGARHLVFSSSATVYGDPDSVPIRESAPIRPTNPYGQTKAMAEQILQDLAVSNPAWKISLLRYFNPVGAHKTGLMGEDPQGIPNNLMPFVAQVAVGRREFLSVFGDDYPTPDGTGVRDYIHVVDLALGHVKALERPGESGLLTVNLGTGRGYSVLEMVSAFKKASGRDVPYRIVARRPGDVATVYADPSTALRELGWKATLDIDDMCRDSWNWQSRNPKGYAAD
ncbi:MAG: UDP-glucose 4-epimerase GalE [Betaproteobacteria bacterium]|nr:UDP-glucose 4-epimerase GalE [Betaproteobacteria bacterium]